MKQKITAVDSDSMSTGDAKSLARANVVKLGCIADDFTGATDLANNLVRSGMRTTQVIGVPSQPPHDEADAVVIALKSRTAPVRDAISESLAALAWLKAQGAEQIYFKYCSTFDSTAAGNIGPVTEALMDALNIDFTIVTPAFPDNKRTVFKGYLFVGDALLNESGMQNHPLTPMTDANLVRVLQAQCQRKIGLIDYAAVAAGEAAIRSRIAALKREGVSIAIVDAISNADLMKLGPALSDLPLVTAGSGVAIGLPQNFSLQHSDQASALPKPIGLRAIVSGSCSTATNRQVIEFTKAGGATLAVDPLQIASGVDVVGDALAWASARVQNGPVLIYSTAEPSAVKSVQSKIGVEAAGAMVECTLANIARGLVHMGVQQLIVAGGETSGACVQALGITQMKIGVQIDPGVPWCYAATDVTLNKLLANIHIALKSGNFGGDDFFSRAFKVIA
jgi:3-dehydrotetronate 4-kinase